MKGYSVVNLKNEDGSYTQGFRKIKSSLDNWENTRDEQEEIYEQALQKALADMKEPSWLDRLFEDSDTKMKQLKESSLFFYGLSGGLCKRGYITRDQYDDCDRDLRFTRDIVAYTKLRAIIKNGEQFMLDDQLCSFVNSYSTYKPKGDK